MSKIICSISGVATNEDDDLIMDTLAPFEDGAAELPVGWSRVTVETRLTNPAFEAIQLAKAGLVSQILAQLPESVRVVSEDMVALQVDAQFAALESRPGNVPTQLQKVQVYIAPPDRVPGLGDELKKIFTSFGLDVEDESNGDDEDDNENDEEEEEEEQEEPAPPAPKRKPKK